MGNYTSEFNRMSKELWEKKYLKLKKETAKLFNSECIGCKKVYDRSFPFHHVWYIEGEKTYLDFENTIDYNLYICPIIQKDQDRFRLMCGDCHGITIKEWKKYNFSKLQQCYKLSKEIFPEYIKEYCHVWVNHEYDLKNYFRAVFGGLRNDTSKKYVNEINNGSLDRWEHSGLEKFLRDKDIKYDNFCHG